MPRPLGRLGAYPDLGDWSSAPASPHPRHSSCVPCPFLFHLGHAQAVADQSATMAAVGPARLRRNPEPGAQGHRTVPALEPVIRTTHDLVSDRAGTDADLLGVELFQKPGNIEVEPAPA